MAKVTKAEVEQRTLKRNAKYAKTPGFWGGAGWGAVESLVNLGETVTGETAGALNWGQRLFTGTDVESLKRFSDKIDRNQAQFEADLLEFGGPALVSGYATARIAGVGAVEYLAGLGILKGFQAVSKLGQGARLARRVAQAEKAALKANQTVGKATSPENIKAAQVAKEAAEAKVVALKARQAQLAVEAEAKSLGLGKQAVAGVAPGVAAGGEVAKRTLWETVKANKGKLIAGTLAAAGVAGGVAQYLKGEKPPPLENIPPRPPRALSKPEGIQQDFRSQAARTYEDLVNVALNKAGYGPEQMALAAGYQGTFAPIMGGNRPSLNPYLGGVAPNAKEAMRYHTGTQEKQAAYQDMLRAQDRAFRSELQAAAQPGLAAFMADRQAQAAEAQALQKQQASASSPQRISADMFKTAMTALNKSEIAARDANDKITADKYRAEQNELARKFLTENKTAEQEASLALQGG